MRDVHKIFRYLKNENNLISFCQYLKLNFDLYEVSDIPYDLRKNSDGETKAIRINFLRTSDQRIYSILSVSSEGDIKWGDNTDTYEKYLLNKIKREKNIETILRETVNKI